MTRVCASGPVVRGIDIYHGDIVTDINAIKKAGIAYVFLKAYELSEDVKFRSSWKAFRAAGILRGAYDFFHPETNPLVQARNFLNIVGTLEKDDLPCVLDWERRSTISSATERANALIWLEYVEEQTGKTPIVYGGPSHLNSLGLDVRFKRFPLWIANYDVKCPMVPNPWDVWTFFQGSESGQVPGVRALCDTDVFNGSLEALQAFALKTSST